MKKDDFLELFEVLEHEIIDAIKQVDHELINTHGSLLVMVSVLTKMAADAAIDEGMSEDRFAESARAAYRIIKPRRMFGTEH